MDISYEQATPAMEGEIVALMREFYAHFEDLHFDEARSPLGVRALLACPEGGRIFLIRNEDQAIGYMVLAFSFHLEFFGRVAWIDEFYVREANRGKGVGLGAMKEAIRFCQEIGVKGVLLELDRVNTEAERFYERLGFEERKHYRTLARAL